MHRFHVRPQSPHRLWTPRGSRRAAPELMCVLLVDERRLPVLEQDGGRRARAGRVPSRLVGRRVLGEGERRAIVRRIAATHEDVALAPHVRSSPSFAGASLDALDRDAVPAAVRDARAARAHARRVRRRARRAQRAAPRRRRRARVRRRDAVRSMPRSSRTPTTRSRGGGSPEAGLALDVVELGAPQPPPLDLRAVDGVVALLRYAASQSDADARRALLAPQSGVRPGRRAHAAGDRRRPREPARRDRERRRRGREPVRARPRHDHRGIQSAGCVGAHSARGDRRSISARRPAGARGARTRRARLRRGARVRRAVGGARSDRRDPGGADGRAARAARASPASRPRHRSPTSRPRRSRCASCRSARRRSTRTPSASASGGSATRARQWRTAARRRRSTGSRSTPRWKTFTPRTRASRTATARSSPPCSITASSRRSTATARGSTRRSSSSCSGGAHAARRRNICRGCWSARAARRSR